MEEGVLGGRRLGEEDPQPSHGQGRPGPDLGRLPPVLPGAPIQKDLEADDEGRQGRKADEVKGSLPPSRIIGHEAGNAQNRDDPERQIDEEDPAPVQVFSDPSPDDGTEDRPQYDG